MKLAKRISIFFIVPVGMYALGFYSHMKLEEEFYPNRYRTIRVEEQSRAGGLEEPGEAGADVRQSDGAGGSAGTGSDAGVHQADGTGGAQDSFPAAGHQEGQAGELQNGSADGLQSGLGDGWQDGSAGGLQGGLADEGQGSLAGGLQSGLADGGRDGLADGLQDGSAGGWQDGSAGSGLGGAVNGQEQVITASAEDNQVISADTQYIIQEVDLRRDTSVETQWKVPDKYIGMDRRGFIREMELYQQSPSLKDQELGFVSVEVVSFSKAKVVIRKSYLFREAYTSFYLVNEKNYVVVYCDDLKTVYMNTNIMVDSLPDKLKQEIIRNKYIATEEELYNFLESYSS